MLAGFIGGFFESGVTPILPLYGLALVVPDRRQGVPVPGQARPSRPRHGAGNAGIRAHELS
jgi:hypothetical protein